MVKWRCRVRNARRTRSFGLRESLLCSSRRRIEVATNATDRVPRIYPALSEPPAHVPPELIRDVDIFNLPGAKDGPHAAWKRMQREMPPIIWTPRNGGYWMALRAKDILTIQNDSVTYSMRASLVPNNPRPYPAPPMDM